MGIAVNGRPEAQLPRGNSKVVEESNQEREQLKKEVERQWLEAENIKVILRKAFSYIVDNTEPDEEKSLKKEIVDILEK